VFIVLGERRYHRYYLKDMSIVAVSQEASVDFTDQSAVSLVAGGA
jgi:hypothetical protein